MAANEDKPGKLFRQSHHAQSRLYSHGLLFKREAGPRDPFLLPGRRALIDLVALPQGSHECGHGFRREP